MVHKMGVGLMPLEFTECLTDSPWFRENLHKHEKELDKTSHQIKRLIKEVKDLLQAAKRLSTAQRTLSDSLEQFDFECIGQSLTEDEIVISRSLKQFAQLIRTVEDERDRMLGRTYEQIIQPLEKFRKEHIGAVKEGKKKFDKKTAKFCQTQERTLNLSTKKQDTVFQEADASLDMAERDFCQASLEYVFLLQEVQERKKFEFVETLLGFMFGWLTFYHQGHEVHKDFKPYMSDLQLRIQKTRNNFEETSKKTESLMKKMMEMRQQKLDEQGRPPYGGRYTRAGYLFLMEKKAFGTTWSKQYCTYEKTTKEFKMTPFNQITSKLTTPVDTMTLTSCVRRMSDTIEKRFCFDITVEGRPGVSYTLQALSEEDRKAWIDAMDGKEPMYSHQNIINKTEERPLDDVGFYFINRCIDVLDSRGLEEQGLYRVAGVSSKVSKLLSMGLDRRKPPQERLGSALDDQCEWESKTITSALKTYLRNLPEPLMTYRFHNGFIAAAKQDVRHLRVNDVHTLIHRLPKSNIEMLDIVIRHLKNVASKSDKNLMTVSNLAVCFGPTLLRPEEETVASIMDLKFYNVVLEILMENYDKVFHSPPDPSSPQEIRTNGGNSIYQELRMPPGGLPVGPQSPPHSRPQQRYSNPTPQGVTHAVAKTYYDGPIPVSAGSPHRAGPPAYQPPPPARAYSPPQRNMQQQHHQTNNLDLHRDNLLNSTSSSNESVSSVSSRDMMQTPSSGHIQLGHANSHTQLVHPQQYMSMNTSQGQLSMNSSQGQISLNNSQGQLNLSNQHIANSHGQLNLTNSQISLGNNHSMMNNSHGSPINHHGSPIKTRRIVNHGMNVHYATSYRPQPQHNVLIGPAASIGLQHNRSMSPGPSLRRVRTLYACVGENDGELSFEPNQIITNVKSSPEPGWLEGTLNGKTGLVPENYVAALP